MKNKLDKETKEYIDKEVERKLAEKENKDLLNGISDEERKRLIKLSKKVIVVLAISVGAFFIVGILIYLVMYLYSLTLL